MEKVIPFCEGTTANTPHLLGNCLDSIHLNCFYPGLLSLTSCELMI